eukprot:CAMPEP_0117691924 /NCGR_PEP_ID=MMETSP0804-20121206/26020_1 /TAXON_ID=1074897 /ORGANISM="Tetraselmis astigmatica, Strain CCMP880" /LENGTH=67 /DNA_ID=CAMNT_0005505271 /DNA_START=118 /DNA_END=321 /DNA_ORIENTATION=+
MKSAVAEGASTGEETRPEAVRHVHVRTEDTRASWLAAQASDSRRVESGFVALYRNPRRGIQIDGPRT